MNSFLENRFRSRSGAPLPGVGVHEMARFARGSTPSVLILLVVLVVLSATHLALFSAVTGNDAAASSGVIRTRLTRAEMLTALAGDEGNELRTKAEQDRTTGEVPAGRLVTDALVRDELFGSIGDDEAGVHGDSTHHDDAGRRRDDTPTLEPAALDLHKCHCVTPCRFVKGAAEVGSLCYVHHPTCVDRYGATARTRYNKDPAIRLAAEKRSPRKAANTAGAVGLAANERAQAQTSHSQGNAAQHRKETAPDVLTMLRPWLPCRNVEIWGRWAGHVGTKEVRPGEKEGSGMRDKLKLTGGDRAGGGGGGGNGDRDNVDRSGGLSRGTRPSLSMGSALLLNNIDDANDDDGSTLGPDDPDDTSRGILRDIIHDDASVANARARRRSRSNTGNALLRGSDSERDDSIAMLTTKQYNDAPSVPPLAYGSMPTIDWDRAAQPSLLNVAAAKSMYDLMHRVHTVLMEECVPYWAAKTLLLGAFHHKGLVGWTDDLDIMMFARDIEVLGGIRRALLRRGVGLGRVLRNGAVRGGGEETVMMWRLANNDSLRNNHTHRYYYGDDGRSVWARGFPYETRRRHTNVKEETKTRMRVMFPAVVIHSVRSILHGGQGNVGESVLATRGSQTFTEGEYMCHMMKRIHGHFV